MTTFEIKMPKLGESITEGTIMSWSVKVGDTIEENDILFDVNTAKVSAEVPSPVAGKIIELLFKEGDTVEIGTVVAIVDIGSEETQDQSPKVDNSKKGETTPAVSTPEKPSEDNSKFYSPVVLQKSQESGVSKEELDTIKGTGESGRV